MNASRELEELTKTPHQLAQTFIAEARNFETSRIKAIERSRTMAWRTATAFGVIALLAVAAVAAMAPLKTVQPFLVRVDNNTGVTDVVSAITDAPTRYDEVMDRYWAAQYTRLREGYDWETIQTTFDATLLLSAERVQNEVKAIYSRPDAPHKVLKDKFQVQIRINAITFIGDLAQVRFEKTVLATDRGGQPPLVTRWIATLAYTYQNVPRKDRERLINPLGYQVTSYRVDQEA